MVMDMDKPELLLQKQEKSITILIEMLSMSLNVKMELSITREEKPLPESLI